MLNEFEASLVKLAEECSELAQVACKCVDFGMHSNHPVSGANNTTRLMEEFVDIVAVMMLVVKKMELYASGTTLEREPGYVLIEFLNDLMDSKDGEKLIEAIKEKHSKIVWYSPNIHSA